MNGKIYKIVGEDGSTYYGSTTQSLKERMRRHRYDKGTTAYQKIISQMDYETILLENYPCESRKELESREGWYIRENPCVNRVVVGRTKKEWYEDHREEELAGRKKYYVENREEIIDNHRKYYADHREEANTRRKKHYYDHREETLEYAKIRDSWIRSFGSIKYENNLQRCDYMLFQ